MTEISVQYCTGTEQVQNQNLRITELSEIYIQELKYPYNLGTALCADRNFPLATLWN